MGEVVYLNGELLPCDQARISPFDRGFLYGDGFFETTRIVRGVPVFLGRHLARLSAACLVAGFGTAPDAAGLGEELRGLVRACGVADGYLRLTVTRGTGRALTELATDAPTIFAEARPMDLPALDATSPITVARARWHPSTDAPTARHKSLSYQANLLSLAEVRSAGADEAYFVNCEGNLCEGAISNLFFVSRGVVHTPCVECALLPGVTRRIALDICRDAALACEEGFYPEAALADAEEVFCTNSLRGIMPVGAIAGLGRGFQSPGPVCARIRAAYAATVQRHVEQQSRCGG